MKGKTKSLWLFVGVMFLLTIISFGAVANTYAKFISKVSTNSGAQGAGFLITSENTSDEGNLSATLLIAPGESKSVGLNFTYFSQVVTEFKETANGTSVTGVGLLATDFSTLISEFQNTWLPNHDYYTDTTTPASLDEMFVITYTDGQDIAEACAEQVRQKGSLTGSGTIVNAMDKTATNSISCSVGAQLTWIEISDAWDTFIGNKVYQDELENSTVSGVKVNVGVRVEQIVGEIIDAPTNLAISSNTLSFTKIAGINSYSVKLVDAVGTSNETTTTASSVSLSSLAANMVAPIKVSVSANVENSYCLAASIDYTPSYSLTLNDVGYEPGKGEEADSATLRIYYANNATQDVVINGNTVARTYTNVIGVALLPSSSSSSLPYTMGTIKSYLYHQGSGNPSAYLQLTDNITIDIKVTAQSCILSNSMVTMADGTQKALGDIKVGDKVLSYDWDTMTLVENEVIYASGEDSSKDWSAVRYFRRTFSDGTVIENAFAHRFYNVEEQAFVHLDYWEIGDKIFKDDGTTPTLVSVEVIYEDCEFGRITLANGTNYFANGMLTGDSGCPTGITLEQLRSALNN